MQKQLVGFPYDDLQKTVDLVDGVWISEIASIIFSRCFAPVHHLRVSRLFFYLLVNR